MAPDVARKDYYGVLRLPFGASEPIIRQRFRRLARRFHPDVNRSPDAASDFREIREAYEVLTDPARRAVVDSWYSSQGPPTWRRRPRAAPDTSSPPPPGAGDGGAPVVPPGGRPSAAWTAWGDGAWSVGCLALLGFFGAFGSALTLAASFSTACFAGLAVAVAGAVLAATGGERTRESLLWIFSFLWW